MVFHWSLRDCMSPQVSSTLLSILAILNNVVVRIVSTRPPTSKSSSPFSNPLVTVPNAPITIGIIVTCMFHSFFNSLAKLRYLSFFSHSFSFILWSTRIAKSTILQVFFFFLLIIIRSGLLAEIIKSGLLTEIIKSGLLAEIRWSVYYFTVEFGSLIICLYTILSYQVLLSNFPTYLGINSFLKPYNWIISLSIIWFQETISF